MSDRFGKLTTSKCFFFAGGGTGGHIYPGIAVAEKIIKLDPEAKIHFFCSNRDIDSRILEQAGFEYTVLASKGLQAGLGKLIGFCSSFFKSYRVAKEVMAKSTGAKVIGIGGYVAGPVCYAAHKIKVPVILLNVDILPGRANKLTGRWADEIFVQFEETAQYFAKTNAKISIVGCPLRSGFGNPQPNKAIEQLGLDKNKKTLLITGASSGSENINRSVCSLLKKLSSFAGDWQIVHLAGRKNYDSVGGRYSGVEIKHKVLGYFDDMADLLAASELVIGRSGAVSVAEYAAAQVPSICIPYPYHKDKHQYLNAGKLADAGAAVIVDDLPDEEERTKCLWNELEKLMKDGAKRGEMKDKCAAIAVKDAAEKIAEKLLKN